jgi:hypothetical protein
MDIRVCYLEEQHRQTDNQLNDILTEIRTGEISEGTLELLESLRGVKTDNQDREKAIVSLKRAIQLATRSV